MSCLYCLIPHLQLTAGTNLVFSAKLQPLEVPFHVDYPVFITDYILFFLMSPFSLFFLNRREIYLLIESNIGLRMSWEDKYGEGALEADSHTIQCGIS